MTITIANEQAFAGTGDPYAPSFSFTPTSGNLLVASVFTRSTSITGITGWTRLYDHTSPNSGDASAWFAKVSNGAETGFSLDVSATDTHVIYVWELNATDGWDATVANNLDKAAETAASTASIKSTGTTATTTQAEAIALTQIALRNDNAAIFTGVTYTNDFVSDDGAKTGGISTNFAGHKILAATGAQETTVDWNDTYSGVCWGSIIVLKPASGAPPANTRRYTLTTLGVG